MLGWGISVSKLISSSTFGHDVSEEPDHQPQVPGGVRRSDGEPWPQLASISITGMRTISGTFDSAAGAYTASKLAAQIETNVARVIAAQNQYLRMSGDAQAQAVFHRHRPDEEERREPVGADPRHRRWRQEGGQDRRDRRRAMPGRSMACAPRARATRRRWTMPPRRSESLSAAFAALAEGAAQGGTLSLIKKTVTAYGTFSRLNGEVARYRRQHVGRRRLGRRQRPRHAADADRRN